MFGKRLHKGRHWSIEDYLRSLSSTKNIHESFVYPGKLLEALWRPNTGEFIDKKIKMNIVF